MEKEEIQKYEGKVVCYKEKINLPMADPVVKRGIICRGNCYVLKIEEGVKNYCLRLYKIPYQRIEGITKEEQASNLEKNVIRTLNEFKTEIKIALPIKISLASP